jgi:alpha-amylase/alpha-mannosidase (GH57 family)
MGKLHGSLFLHANMHYAEIPKVRLPELATRSYMTALEGLIARKGVKAAIEFSGYSLEWLAANAPQVIELTRSLVRRGDAEVMGSTYADPILPLLPPDDGARQVRRYLEIHERIFGDIQPVVKGFYTQEYAMDAATVDMLAGLGMKWVVLSSGHYKISKKGQLNSALQRIQPQEEFAMAEPVPRPFDVVGARGAKIAAVTWNNPGPSDIVASFKEGRNTWAEVEAYFASLQARYCAAQDGLVLLFPADMEFVGDMAPQGYLPADKWGEILDGYAGSPNLELILPSVFMEAHPEREALYLKCGAGARFSDLQNWTADPDNARLNYLCDDARSQIRLAEAMTELVDALGFPAAEAREQLATAREHLLQADNSDGRGWKPLPERRLDCYDHALYAREAAAAALTAATGAVRRGRG